MIPPDFSLNAPHSTEEEMGRLSSSRKVVEGFGRKVGKPVGGREVVGIGAPRAKRGVHTRTGGARTDGREHNSARREMLVGSLGQGSTGTDRLARHTWVLFFTVLVNKFHR